MSTVLSTRPCGYKHASLAHKAKVRYISQLWSSLRHGGEMCREARGATTMAVAHLASSQQGPIHPEFEFEFHLLRACARTRQPVVDVDTSCRHQRAPLLKRRLSLHLHALSYVDLPFVCKRCTSLLTKKQYPWPDKRQAWWHHHE